MDTKTVVTLGALAVAGLAIVLGSRNSVSVAPGTPTQLGGVQLGNAPVFNFAGGNGQYMGAGGYPPFNSCGCGRADNGLRVAASISPVFADAIETLPGVKQINDPVVPQLLTVGNGAFV